MKTQKRITLNRSEIEALVTDSLMAEGSLPDDAKCISFQWHKQNGLTAVYEYEEPLIYQHQRCEMDAILAPALLVNAEANNESA